MFHEFAEAFLLVFLAEMGDKKPAFGHGLCCKISC